MARDTCIMYTNRDCEKLKSTTTQWNEFHETSCNNNEKGVEITKLINNNKIMAQAGDTTYI